MQKTQTKALIIGGGIGGLAAAVALQRVGIEAEVFERAPEIQEVGAALSIWSNAVLALRRLGLEEPAVKLGSTIECVRTVSDRGQLLSETAIGDMSQQAGAASICIHRADLQRTLLEALDPVRVHTGHTCVGFEQNAEGVTAHFMEGRSAQGTFLIGADGLHSVVREKLLGPSEPRAAGYFAWRGMAQWDQPELPPGLSLFALGRGIQLGLFRCGEGRVYWFATRNAPPGRTGKHSKEDVLAVFRDWPAPIPAVIQATEESALLENDILDRPPTWPWGTGRVTLLGDAIHPTTPNLGQGACMALEDAVFLADALRQASDVELGLRTYEEKRRERTTYVVKQSWTLGKIFQWQNPLAVWLRGVLMKNPLAARQGVRTFEKLLCYTLPEVSPST